MQARDIGVPFPSSSAVIARSWHGAVPLAKSAEYLDLMRRVAIPDYAATPGNCGAYCLHREDGELAHFEMLSLWKDIDAIRRFAGDDIHFAKYYDFDASFLIEMEPTVIHHTCYEA